MPERTMTEYELYEFARTTYDPALTEKLGRIVDARGLVDQFTPRLPTNDEVAFGFNMNEVELRTESDGTTTLTHKNEMARQLGRVSAEEMHQAKTTMDFYERQEEAETEFKRSTFFSGIWSSYGPYIQAYMWPRERAWYKARALSLDETSGISTDAVHKVDEMYDEAYGLNEAYDVVTSNGAYVEIPHKRDRSPEGRDLRGDRLGGKGTYRIPVLKTEKKIYDIQDGSAVRWSEQEGRYVPFAPQHQGRAIRAMRNAAIKAMDRSDDTVRANAVKKAKETLGRAGVRIPKHTA